MTRPPKEPGVEQYLWERVKDTVSPLRGRKHETAAVRRQENKADTTLRKAISPKQTNKSERAKMQKAPAVPEDRSAQKQIRRGRIETQARIDLHGKTHDEAKNHLLHRLNEHHQEGLRSVLVITGRGEKDEGVLRLSLPIWLKEGDFRTLVSGFAPAHMRHGGKGAWYVFLRSAR